MAVAPAARILFGWRKVLPNGSDCANVSLSREAQKQKSFSSCRPEIGRGYPLNLSISLSGGKETNQDSPSNGE